jgi:hypothetical protein
MRPIKRALELGPQQTFTRCYWRFREAYLTLYWKRHLNRKAPSSLPFARHIPIPNHAVATLSERHSDIRCIWQETIDFLFSTPTTSDSFKSSMTSWLDANPFMRGVQWMSTMEVARRAINMIAAYHHYTLAANPDTNFVKRYTESLNEHLVYIRAFPETSATPNNHYLTDLVGHLDLAKFFNLTDEVTKVEQLLEQEFNRQILPDGTSYEGSTSYHRYVFELFAHYLTLKSKPTLADRTRLHQGQGKPLDPLSRSINISRITIGDEGPTLFNQDIVSRLSHDVIPFDERYFYPHFGLGIIAHRPWYVTLRHPTYQKHQPTGHFHDDELSVTASYGTVQLLVDPGTGLYTGNPLLRNTLRHASSHSTFAPITPISYPHLFVLPRTVCPPPPIDLPHIASLKRKDLTQSRTLTIDADTGTVIINDSWTATKPIALAWNFIFHPDILVIQTSPTTLSLQHPKQSFILTTTLPLALSSTPYSPTYGQIIDTTKATATIENTPEGAVTTTISPQ